MLLVDVHTGTVKACMSNKRTTMDAVPPLGPDGEELLAVALHVVVSWAFCTQIDLPAAKERHSHRARCSRQHRHQHWLLSLSVVNAAGPNDGVLRWLEEFAARLAAGQYQVATFADAGVPRTPALSLFDLARPNTTEAVRSMLDVPACAADCLPQALSTTVSSLGSPSKAAASCCKHGLKQSCCHVWLTNQDLALSDVFCSRCAHQHHLSRRPSFLLHAST
jgi:hypothetical protein